MPADPIWRSGFSDESKENISMSFQNNNQYFSNRKPLNYKNQSIEPDKIINDYKCGLNYYNGFAIGMAIDNNQSLILPIMIYQWFFNRNSLFYRNQ